MSLFAELAIPQAPKQLTPTERSKEIADQVLNAAKQNLANFIAGTNQIMSAVWENQEPNITAQSIVEQMDTKALALFRGHANLVACLISEEPELDKIIKKRPDWAEITFEVQNNAPTGRVLISQKE